MTTKSIAVGKSSVRASGLQTALNAAWRLWKAWQSRREVIGLLEADDRMLADIGLSRGDVVGSLSAPVDVDPSHHLIRARAERMSARAHRLRR